MKLTPTQYLILEHRISGGTIAEVLADTEDLNVTYDEAQIAVDAVEKMINSRNLPLETLTPLELEVVIDCLDGSTFFASADNAIACGEYTRSKLNTALKAAAELEDAVSKVAGRRVSCACT